MSRIWILCCGLLLQPALAFFTPATHPLQQAQRARELARFSTVQNETVSLSGAVDSGVKVASKGRRFASEDEIMKEREVIKQGQEAAAQASRLMSMGASPRQIEAYTGIKYVPMDEEVDVQLKVAPSHTIVDKDKDGELKQASFVYVDEYTCIGCTNCATTAPNTFFMEDEHGRARVFKQWGDRKGLIQTAIETCPVDCIHYVPYEELQRLEKERQDLYINFKSRLVGSEGLLSSSGKDLGMQDISGNRAMRCLNCPSKGCFKCPMYSVGENPEYKKRQAIIAAKRAEQKRAKEQVKRKRTEL